MYRYKTLYNQTCMFLHTISSTCVPPMLYLRNMLYTYFHLLQVISVELNFGSPLSAFSGWLSKLHAKLIYLCKVICFFYFNLIFYLVSSALFFVLLYIHRSAAARRVYMCMFAPFYMLQVRVIF